MPGHGPQSKIKISKRHFFSSWFVFSCFSEFSTTVVSFAAVNNVAEIEPACREGVKELVSKVLTIESGSSLYQLLNAR